MVQGAVRNRKCCPGKQAVSMYGNGAPENLYYRTGLLNFPENAQNTITFGEKPRLDIFSYQSEGTSLIRETVDLELDQNVKLKSLNVQSTNARKQLCGGRT